MKISEFSIHDEYISCNKNEKILDILKKVRENKEPNKKINYIVVIDDKKPVGIISFRDIVLRLVGEKKVIGDIKAEDVMTTPVMTTKLSRDAKEIFNLMVQMGFRSLPVVDDKENLMGCITINDLAEKIDEK